MAFDRLLPRRPPILSQRPVSQYEPADQAKAAALRLLSHRPRSVYELKDRLAQRFPTEAVESAVTSLVHSSLVDDEAFALWWTEARTGSRPMARSKIRAELIKKGIARGVIGRAIAEVDDVKNAMELARQLTRKLTKDDYNRFASRLTGRLSRRGYSHELVRSVVKTIWAEMCESKGGKEVCDL